MALYSLRPHRPLAVAVERGLIRARQRTLARTPASGVATFGPSFLVVEPSGSTPRRSGATIASARTNVKPAMACTRRVVSGSLAPDRDITQRRLHQVDQDRLRRFGDGNVACRVADGQAQEDVVRDARRQLPGEPAGVGQVGADGLPLAVLAPPPTRPIGLGSMLRSVEDQLRITVFSSRVSISGTKSLASGGVTSSSTRICGVSPLWGGGLPKPGRSRPPGRSHKYPLAPIAP